MHDGKCRVYQPRVQREGADTSRQGNINNNISSDQIKSRHSRIHDELMFSLSKIMDGALSLSLPPSLRVCVSLSLPPPLSLPVCRCLSTCRFSPPTDNCRFDAVYGGNAFFRCQFNHSS